ncbi:MAG: hypothetical protein KDD64_12245 [Bdellovibrionales bacterium]|nr:hypothetical protein [Bdellovibrionales bacterium]
MSADQARLSTTGTQGIDINQSVGEGLVRPGIAETRLRVGSSNFFYSGNEPRFVQRDGSPVTSVQEGMCKGVSDTRAPVDGNFLISMQFLHATGGDFHFKSAACVEGDLRFTAARSGSVGGSLTTTIDARIKGLEVHDADPDGGGFADKSVTVSHAQEMPLKVVFEPSINFLETLDVVIGCSSGTESILVYGGNTARFAVRETIADGTRTLSISLAE